MKKRGDVTVLMMASDRMHPGLINAVESLNMSLRKIIKTRGSFPSEQAALKLLYLALKNVVAKWQRMGVPHWKGALNQFALLWEDRIRATARM